MYALSRSLLRIQHHRTFLLSSISQKKTPIRHLLTQYPTRTLPFSTSGSRWGPTAATSPESHPVIPSENLTPGERAVFDKVNEHLSPAELEVQDVSGGCGSMYAINITSSKFKGMSIIQQHRLVNQVLKEDIQQWHGVRLSTRAPK